MVQEFHVLKCFSCQAFQSHIVKKLKKWECKLCGNKQSIKKVYGRGSGKDCRLHTQKLNTLRGEKEDSIQHVWKSRKEANEDLPEQSQNNPSFIKTNRDSPKASKWTAYMDEGQIDFRNKNSSTRKRWMTNCENRLNNDRFSKRKRKYETNEPDFVDQQSNNTEAGGLLDDDYFSISFSNSTEDEKKTKYEKCYKKNYNEHTRFCLNDNVETFVEDEEKVTTPNNLKVKRQPNQNIPAKISLKWAKYLEDVPTDENALFQNCSVFPASGDYGKRTENNSDPTEYRGFDISNSGEITNVYNNRNSSTACSLNLCDSVRSELTSNTLFEEASEGLVVDPVSKIATKQQNIHLEKAQSNLQLLLPLPIFEQNCDLSDIDIQLDF